MKGHFLFILILPFVLFGQNKNDLSSQNLIKNPSFEIDSLRINLTLDLSNNFTPANWWAFPKGVSPDYFCTHRKNQLGVPNNVFGWQSAFDGENYVGISIISSTVNYTEFIQTKLILPLEPNKYYCFGLHVSLSEWGNGTYNEIDYLLSKTNNTENVAYKAITSSKIIKSKDNWVELTSLFKANGGEEFLTIGMFNKTPKFIRTKKQEIVNQTHYYLDEISLIEVSDTAACITRNNESSFQNINIAFGKPLPLKNIYFHSNSSQLIKSSYPELNYLADYLKKNPIYTLEILGHTDNSGNESENKALSNGRAKSVYEFLVSKGISDKRITYKGYGSSKPLKPNTTEENKLINRRVEIILKK